MSFLLLPLYCLGENCGGSYHYTKDGIKDCSGCLRPYRRENYDVISRKMQDILKLVKKKSEKP